MNREKLQKQFEETFRTELSRDLTVLFDWWWGKLEKSRLEENQAWLKSKRCHTCGNPMKSDGLSDTCKNCFENE